MEPLHPPLAREALDALSKRWEFTPKGPILIEVFPRHDDFAVRNVGLPGMIGALGACFGRVVTMDSPRARPPGEFNWGVTLWHELAHVITLQLSEQRVPRWLTEGISVCEEKRARPEWGREMDIPFARAIDRGQVLKLRTSTAASPTPRRFRWPTTSPRWSSITSSRSSASRSCARSCSRSPTASTPRRRSSRCWASRSTRCRRPSTCSSSSASAALRKALAAPEGLSATCRSTR